MESAVDNFLTSFTEHSAHRWNVLIRTRMDFFLL